MAWYLVKHSDNFTFTFPCSIIQVTPTIIVRRCGVYYQLRSTLIRKLWTVQQGMWPPCHTSEYILWGPWFFFTQSFIELQARFHSGQVDMPGLQTSWRFTIFRQLRGSGNKKTGKEEK